MKKYLKQISSKICSYIAIVFIILIWQVVCELELVESFMLPSPVNVAKTFFNELPILVPHIMATMTEAMLGLFIGIILGFVLAVMMDNFEMIYKAFYPLMVITQTIPAVAIAPLLVLWFGYGIAPKVILIVITTFFPIAVGLTDGFKNADADGINLLKAMGANKLQIFWHIKFPGALTQFFAGIKISASYAVVGAVIAEWLGGFNGLGVYMTRVKKAFSFDKMFAVIILISAISLVLMKIVDMLEKRFVKNT